MNNATQGQTKESKGTQPWTPAAHRIYSPGLKPGLNQMKEMGQKDTPKTLKDTEGQFLFPRLKLDLISPV